MTQGTKKYTEPVIERVKLEDKEVITMATGCKTSDMSIPGRNQDIPCWVGATGGSCFEEGS
jgi:hypothetical protein